MVCLDDRELKIIKKLFGLGDSEQKSIKEISLEMELSQERISQVRDKAILKMQSSALINNINYEN
jgi:DNA-directed RNA polymerase sigma subunit (sigma70/sigma32)